MHAGKRHLIPFLNHTYICFKAWYCTAVCTWGDLGERRMVVIWLIYFLIGNFSPSLMDYTSVTLNQLSQGHDPSSHCILETRGCVGLRRRVVYFSDVFVGLPKKRPVLNKLAASLSETSNVVPNNSLPAPKTHRRRYTFIIEVFLEGV